ncbi:MAG TPA: phage holin family protein [Promineifilum sp.]
MPNLRFWRAQFNWRLILVQSIVNAITLGLIVVLLPGIRMPHDNLITELLASGVIFGLLNAFVRPILQFIMFRYLFITFGLVLVVINMAILWIMASLTPDRFQVDGPFSLILAGLLTAILGGFLETVMGLQPPIQDLGPVARSKERLFSLGSAPIYVTSDARREPKAEQENARPIENTGVGE